MGQHCGSTCPAVMSTIVFNGKHDEPSEWLNSWHRIVRVITLQTQWHSMTFPRHQLTF